MAKRLASKGLLHHHNFGVESITFCATRLFPIEPTTKSLSWNWKNFLARETVTLTLH